MNMKAATYIFYIFLGFTLETILSEYSNNYLICF